MITSDILSSMVAGALKTFLDRHRKTSGRKVAVLDADGTMWRGDVGEAFFRYQVERNSIPHAPKKNAWETYHKESTEGDTVKAYGWLAQWNAGVSEDDLVRWCEEYFRDQWVHHVFEPMRAFSHALLNSGFEVWVISGSMKWIVQAGARGFGIQPERVLGTAVSVENGALTDRIEHVVPYRAGKARLIESIIGVKPLFAAGNTYWDKEMMSTATELALAIHSESEGEPNFDSEQRLRKLAESNRWLVQKF